jgi:alanine racemase
LGLVKIGARSPLSTRRLFLERCAALSALSLVPERLLAADASFDPWIEISAENLRRNVREVARRAGGRPILAVAKNNGYGLGVVNAASVFEACPEVAGLAVVKLAEATALRDAGIKKPILLLGPLEEDELALAAARTITPMLYRPQGAALERAAAKLGHAVGIQVCVDTGIGRVGVPYREATALIADLAGRRSVRIDGVMMTFTEDPEFDKEQLRRFLELTDALTRAGSRLGRRHAASSFALFQNPDSFLDMVRPGMALYGVYSEPPFRGLGLVELRPAFALRARVAYVKQLRAGDSAGYERAYRAKQDVYVATLPVGHADGLPRAAAKGAKVRIGGTPYPIIASVSASHTIVEIGGEPKVAIGDVATPFDWSEGSRPEDFAAACGASVYDLAMHLNPLLPRRII